MRALVVTFGMIICGNMAIAQENPLRDPLSAPITRELAILSSMTGVDEAAIKRVRSKVDSALESIDKPDRLFDVMLGHVPPEIFVATMAAAKMELGKSELLARYEKDVATRRKFRQDAAANMFLLQLDRAVGLRTNQWDRATKVVRELSQNDALPHIFATENKKPDSSGTKALKSLLTDEQFEFWNKNYANVRNAVFSPSTFEGNFEKKMEELRTKLRNVAAARTAWLRDEFNLTPAQTRKLELTAKGAISRRALLDDRMEAEAEFSAILNGQVGRNLEINETRLAKADAATLLSRFGWWRQLTDKVLTDDQKATRRKLDLKRASLQREAYNKMNVLSVARELTLNAEQLIGFARLIDRAVPPANPDDIGSPYTGLAYLQDIDAADYEKAIGKENWLKLAFRLNQM
ncbi:MAG: hypothetical protein AAF483_21235 [Planctomycetota bacterium]